MTRRGADRFWLPHTPLDRPGSFQKLHQQTPIPVKDRTSVATSRIKAAYTSLRNSEVHVRSRRPPETGSQKQYARADSLP